MSTSGRGNGTVSHSNGVANRLRPRRSSLLVLTERERSACVRELPSRAIQEPMNGPHQPTVAERAMNRRTIADITPAGPSLGLGARVLLPTEARTPLLKIL